MSKKNADNYKIESKEKFNQQAKNYDSGSSGKHARGLYDNVLNKLDKFTFNNLLDVGCGTGNLLSVISNKYNVKIAGVDLTPNMLDIARDKLGYQADLRLGDSENLPFEDYNFDMVICTDSFHHYPHPDKVLKEFSRVLKTSGGLLIADPYAPSPFRQLLNLYFPHSKGGEVRMYSKAEIIKLLEKASFKDIKWELVGRTGFIVTSKLN
ncbi:MAG: class I SAM-dependent methyltransferase [Methanobacterium sp.]|jgi:ubiquinone/menaquinone biosynthesis C-methylase UbiE